MFPGDRTNIRCYIVKVLMASMATLCGHPTNLFVEYFLNKLKSVLSLYSILKAEEDEDLTHKLVTRNTA